MKYVSIKKEILKQVKGVPKIMELIEVIKNTKFDIPNLIYLAPELVSIVKEIIKAIKWYSENVQSLENPQKRKIAAMILDDMIHFRGALKILEFIDQAIFEIIITLVYEAVKPYIK